MCVQNLSCMYVLVCGCSGRSVCHQCWTVQLLSRVLWTSLAAITSALVQWTAIIHCSGVMYYYHSGSVVFFVCDHVVCVQNLSCMYVLVCGCSGRSVCHQCWTVQLLSRVLWTSLAAFTSALVQWTAATIHCSGVMYYHHSGSVVFFVCDRVVCVQNLSCMYVLVCGCSGRSVCHQCWTVQLLSRVLWTSLAAITSALVQWTAATIHCAGVMYYYHSGSVVFFVCDRVVCVQNLSFMYVLVCGCSGRSVCHQCLTVQLLSRVLWTSLAAITSALVQWTAIIHCSGVMYYYHSQMFVHQVRMLPMQHPISLKFRCVFLHLALSRVVSHLAPTQSDD